MKKNICTQALITLFLSCFSSSFGAFAQVSATYPDKPIKIIVSFTASGTTDILAREVSNQLSIKWKVPVIVENKAGAAGNLGTETVGHAPADGYTLLASSIGPVSINPTLFKSLAVNPQVSLQPIAMLGEIPSVLVVPSTIDVNNWKDFVQYTKANSDNLNYSSTGIGTAAHLVGYLFAHKTHMNATHIPYKGAEATRDLVAGRISFMFATAPSVIPLIKAGQLIPVAVSSKKRMSTLPNVPTLGEVGVDLTTSTWFGLFGPSGMSPSLTKKINEAVVQILTSSDVKSKLNDLGVDPIAMTSAEFTKYVRDDYSMWAPIVKASGAKPE